MLALHEFFTFRHAYKVVNRRAGRPEATGVLALPDPVPGQVHDPQAAFLDGFLSVVAGDEEGLRLGAGPVCGMEGRVGDDGVPLPAHPPEPPQGLHRHLGEYVEHDVPRQRRNSGGGSSGLWRPRAGRGGRTAAATMMAVAATGGRNPRRPSHGRAGSARLRLYSVRANRRDDRWRSS